LGRGGRECRRLSRMIGSRIFVVEPFLRLAENHFIEVACALDHELTATSVEYAIIGHVNLDGTVRDLLPAVVAGIEQTAFEDLDDRGRSFLKDLRALDSRYGFRAEDLVVIPTAYENQVLAVEEFVGERGWRAPGIAVVFHQLFPPSATSTDVRLPSFRRLWKARLRAAFRVSSSPRVSYWTTESPALNRAYRRLSGREVGMLPVPFQRFSALDTDMVSHPRPFRPVVGFLGEARQEKGLHLFLEAARILKDCSDDLTFVVQLNRPRGYGSRELEHLEALLATMRANGHVEIREGALESAQQHELISSLDLLVLPYDPFNYCRRLSGLAVEAAIYGTPVLASSGTWTARAIREGLLAGAVFPYRRSNPVATARGIADCLRDGIANTLTGNCGRHFRETYNPGEFLRRILTYYA
jgi:glycosyltransferase involved in cell wall biosynthesis